MTLIHDDDPVRREMVVGLAFNPDSLMVALVLKDRGPECVIGHWNGVGGKVEDNERLAEAMAREFREETGAVIAPEEWSQFATYKATNYDLHFFYAFSRNVCPDRCRTQETEQIGLFDPYNLPEGTMGNILWMVPFILDPHLCKGSKNLGELQAHR